MPGRTPRTVVPTQVLDFFCVRICLSQFERSSAIEVFRSNFDGWSTAKDHRTKKVVGKLLVRSTSVRINVFFTQFWEKRCSFLADDGSRCPFEGGLDFFHKRMMICVGCVTRLDESILNFFFKSKWS